MLLTDHLLDQERTKEERLFILAQELERVPATYIRQTMYTEFELDAHARCSAARRCRAGSHAALLRPAAPVPRCRPGPDDHQPARLPGVGLHPHFQRPFYVYQYATSMAAAYHFGEQIHAGRPGQWTTV